MDAAWWRVQEIERRLRDAGHSVDVERAKLRSMLGEVRELWRRVADSEVEVDRALAGPISRDVYADYIIAGGANPSDYPIKDVQVTTYFADGVVADSQLTDIDGHVDIMTPVSGGTIKYECPRYETINATIGSPPDDVEISMEPATGYRALNANAARSPARPSPTRSSCRAVCRRCRFAGSLARASSPTISPTRWRATSPPRFPR
jgi:hypothetical protein